MKKTLIFLFILFVSFSIFSSTPIVSNELVLGIVGDMPMTYKFQIIPETSIDIDVLSDSGSQIPIAYYVFSSNSVADTSLRVYPSGNFFNIKDVQTGSMYGYEVAVCTYDGLGNVSSIMQFDKAKLIQIKPPIIGKSEKGEIFACLGYNSFNEIPSGVYSSDLYFEVTIP